MEFQEKENQIYRSSNNLVEHLFQYIENQKKQVLSVEEKDQIIKSLYSFILDDSTVQEYSEYISAFIVKCSSNPDLLKQLHTIKEGVVLYTGLRYNSNLNDLGGWNSQFTIFIETEILFHFAGYNGELFKILFNDFYTLVNEINSYSLRREKKKKILLRYFPQVHEEIERFFKKAEFIVEGKDVLDPSKTAMSTIVNGCNAASDVIEKKTIFYELLKTHGIEEDTYDDYFSNDCKKYNIEDNLTIEELQSYGLSEIDIRENLRFLNYVNIRRRGSSGKNFENVGYILLSGNSTMIKLAWNGLIKSDKEVPLATTLNFLTNKFWFKLGKGFGVKDFPKTFDVITKAQIVLSSQINDNISEKYELLQKKYKNGELSEDQARATIIELRNQVKKPEDILGDELDSILDCISETNIDRYIKEYELFKQRFQEQEEENINLKSELQETKRISEKNIQTIESQNIILKKYEQRLIILENNEIKQKFYRKRKEYTLKRRDLVKGLLKKYQRKAIFFVLLYLFVIILDIMANIYITQANELTINRIIAQCILCLIPFLVVFLDGSFLRNKFKYLFHKGYRKALNKNIIHTAIADYKKSNQSPIMRLKKEI